MSKYRKAPDIQPFYSDEYKARMLAIRNKRDQAHDATNKDVIERRGFGHTFSVDTSENVVSQRHKDRDYSFVWDRIPAPRRRRRSGSNSSVSSRSTSLSRSRARSIDRTSRPISARSRSPTEASHRGRCLTVRPNNHIPDSYIDIKQHSARRSRSLATSSGGDGKSMKAVLYTPILGISRSGSGDLKGTVSGEAEFSLYDGEILCTTNLLQRMLKPNLHVLIVSNRDQLWLSARLGHQLGRQSSG
jgi:hypothetical protein